MNRILTRHFLGTFLLILFTNLCIAQEKFYLLGNNAFNSVEEWKGENGNSLRWQKATNTTTRTFPEGNDIIVLSSSGEAKFGSKLNINFDLNQISSLLEVDFKKYDATLYLGKSGKANLKLTTNNIHLKITTEENSSLIIRDELNLSQGTGGNDELDISGYVFIQKQLVLKNSGINIYVREAGHLEINSFFESENGGKIYIMVCGKLTIDSDLSIKGQFEINTCDGTESCGEINIGGDFNYKCDGSENNSITGCGNINAGTCTECVSHGQINFCDDLDLPVELVYFKGQKTVNGHLLLWETASELNSSHFDVEVSSDRMNWEKISTIQAAGNSNVTLKYQYLDAIESGLYYRLAQYDLDGAVEYFGIVSFNGNNTDFSVTVYPTKITNDQQLKVEVQNANETYPVVGVLYNTNGVLLSHDIIVEQPSGSDIGTFTLPPLQSGMFILKVSNGINTEAVKLILE
ncbi:hypothetical protein KMW28_05150 [Flammeovirga yaeyamensis]|uniref:Secretion system C-terminal sorting domain-containing protein n=1 Tax=Flammeovirga yaeyamensis TaxID=367791 RepID=A0AAX1N5X1_9BACT|nr:hypothetical protein [Flammeovirga yaeyamensis]MBB3697546.1 hypothetical protein [Flammeovirga yaeyamensis]NMF36240.1 hypothetical protein [Flammeovirga yaeyamensis]QWG02969.1 hypothetical protein KMW28_05150 [Flammeovirga yaeyamensis]